jgi:hypothetical protein
MKKIGMCGFVACWLVGIVALALPPSADAFVMHDQYWFQVMVRYGFDFGPRGAAARGGVEIDVSPKLSNAFIGGTFEMSGRHREWGIAFMGFDLTLNGGYCFQVAPVNAFALPVYLRLGLVDSKAGMVVAGGVQGLAPAHLGWNGNFDVLGTLRIRIPNGVWGREAIAPFSPGLEFGAGFATLQGNESPYGYDYYYY